MEWIRNFQLFLFDFDGLLVNTEELHFRAYKKMCQDRGFYLDWSFEKYCLLAHYDTETLRNAIMDSIPELRNQESDWNVLYPEKMRAYLELMGTADVQMMEGASHLLQKIHESNIPSCVVTHSHLSQVHPLKEMLPALKLIPNWITRNDYLNPKPSPDCYQTAIRYFAKDGDVVVGFEDSPRGVSALMGVDVLPVMVTKVNYPEIPKLMDSGVNYYQSFSNINSLG